MVSGINGQLSSYDLIVVFMEVTCFQRNSSHPPIRIPDDAKTYPIGLIRMSGYSIIFLISSIVGARSFVCFSSTRHPSSNFIPVQYNVVHYAEEFNRFVVIWDSGLTNFADVASVFLVFYKFHERMFSPCSGFFGQSYKFNSLFI